MTIICKSLIYHFESRTGAHYVPRKDYVYSDSEFELINPANTGSKVKVSANTERFVHSERNDDSRDRMLIKKNV